MDLGHIHNLGPVQSLILYSNQSQTTHHLAYNLPPGEPFNSSPPSPVQLTGNKQ